MPSLFDLINDYEKLVEGTLRCPINMHFNLPYARHYKPRLVYFLPHSQRPFMYCDLWPYVWLIIESGFKSRAAYGGAYGIYFFFISKKLVVTIIIIQNKMS